MTAPPRQLVLDLAHRSALDAEDFLVSRSNAAAVDLVDRWPDWPHAAALVAGPAGSGKTHLAHVWQLRSGAEALAAAQLSEAAIAELGGRGALAVEDLDRGIADERLLFHLLNLAREHKLSILLTSRLAAGELDFQLPDLRSRLRALPMVRIDSPDEALLQAVLVKLFNDRQLEVEPHVVSFLARRMERSLAAASRIVAEVDRLALALRRKVTRPLAAAALGLSEQEEESD
jgi:chromosomal replication initiation ATPase DnaA